MKFFVCITLCLAAAQADVSHLHGLNAHDGHYSGHSTGVGPVASVYNLPTSYSSFVSGKAYSGPVGYNAGPIVKTVYTAAPHSYNTAHSIHAAGPLAYGAAPSVYTAGPHAYGPAPSVHGAAGHAYSVAPVAYAAAPHAYGPAPLVYAVAPQAHSYAASVYGAGPHAYGVASSVYGAGPHAYGAAPALIKTVHGIHHKK